MIGMDIFDTFLELFDEGNIDCGLAFLAMWIWLIIDLPISLFLGVFWRKFIFNWNGFKMSNFEFHISSDWPAEYSSDQIGRASNRP